MNRYTNKKLNIGFLLITIVLMLAHCSSTEDTRAFNKAQDLLLLHYDFKTDADDLHSVAAFGTLLKHPDFSKINYHAIVGTYGIQEGLYIPPNDLCQLTFGAHWSDAHEDFSQALSEALALALATIDAGGDIWIAEGGQSDFSAALGKAIQSEKPILDVKARIHIVQHSDWNEKMTSPEAFTYVKVQTDYLKIPDGNAKDNGTPGFNSYQPINLKEYLADAHLLSIWQLAIDVANQYNGQDGRYLNEAMAAGGLDFSDFSEVCWILDLKDFRDDKAFFSWFEKGLE